MSMYKYTRQEVAEKLSISTRSVDRYIKAGKLRAKKDGKVVYVKGADVDALLGGTSSKQEVIIPKAEKKSSQSQPVQSKSVSIPNEVNGTLENIYGDLREQIEKKDTTIQNLSMQLGKYEEIAKNSVSLIEFKKSQFLLDESKTYLTKEVEELKVEKERIDGELRYEKKSNLILIIFVVILLAVSGAIMYVNI